jgi:hypothetical protein
MKPARTPAALLDRLASQVEELGEQRHRQRLAEMFPPRPACERHGWVPERGPGLIDATALASLCPACRSERKQAEREAEMPEVVTLDLYGGDLRAQKLWADARDAMERAGHVLGGSAMERELLRTIDDERRLEVAALRETADDRRRYSREHWGRKMRVHRRQQYTPHPARAGE